MPTAEDLLAQMTGTSSNSADKENRFTISEDLRTIGIPEGQEVLGVVNDFDIRRIFFTMPPECDGTDLSTFTPCVNYVNASGKRGLYMASDLEEEDGLLKFSWLVGKLPMESAGEVVFNVSLKAFDADGSTVKQAFNTTTATMTVLEGLGEADGEGGQQSYLDDIASYVNSVMDEKVAEFEDRIKDAGLASDEQIDAILNDEM